MQELENPAEVPQSVLPFTAVFCGTPSLSGGSQDTASLPSSSPVLLCPLAFNFSLAGNNDLTEGRVQKSEGVQWPTPFSGLTGAIPFLSQRGLQDKSLGVHRAGYRSPVSKGKPGGQPQWGNPEVHRQNTTNTQPVQRPGVSRQTHS